MDFTVPEEMERDVAARSVLGVVGRGHWVILRDFNSKWVETKRRRPQETNPRNDEAPGFRRLEVEAPGIEPSGTG